MQIITLCVKFNYEEKKTLYFNVRLGKYSDN